MVAGAIGGLNAKEITQVRKFHGLMLSILKENAHKGGWNETGTETLLKLLEGEVEELREAVENGDGKQVIHEAADVANYAMMVASSVGRHWEGAE